VNRKAIDLQQRTHSFFVRVIQFSERLPSASAAQRIRLQLLDSAGGTDSNYRAACKARTRKEFIAKIGVAAEEADESYGWLAALLHVGYGERGETQALLEEADALTRIFVASHKTAQKRLAAEQLERRRRRRR
jgi:four helix bundle protein